MLDPRNGEVLALASTPTYSASAPVRSCHRRRDVQGAPGGRGPAAAAARDAGSLRAGVGVQDRDRHRRPRLRGDHAADDVRGAARRPRRRPRRQRFPDPRWAPPVHRLERLDLVGATEVSCNIWYALTGLETGGADLVDYAGALGFGAPLPFDLPTAISQVTNGSGERPGRVRRRRGAGECRLRPGRDVRDASPDGPRREHRRERRRAACGPAS